MTNPRLDDPDEHYPYKGEAALQGGLSQTLVDLTDAYICAQAELVADPTEGNKARYREAGQALADARRAERVEKESGFKNSPQDGEVDLDSDPGIWSSEPTDPRDGKPTIVSADTLAARMEG